MEKAAGQGHAYAMYTLGLLYNDRKEYEQAIEWYTKGAEAGLPAAMFNLAVMLDKGEGAAAPDYPAAAHWYRSAADADAGDDGAAANNLSVMYTLGRGRAWQIMPATTSSTL